MRCIFGRVSLAHQENALVIWRGSVRTVKNKKAFEDFKKRRSMRGAKQGQALEAEVEKVLNRMKERGELVQVIHHFSNSPEDRDGRDFTVSRYVEGQEVFCSFGVTISLRRWYRGKTLHRDVPQFCFRLDTKPETIRGRVLELFEAGRRT